MARPTPTSTVPPLFASKLRRVSGAGALFALALGGVGLGAAPPTWNQVFGDTRPAVHLTATYPDAQGKPQVLDYWRGASGQVVRRTGGRAELRLTPAKDGEDLYQLRNLLTRTAFDVHRVNLVRVGLFTDRWSVQHLLDKPAGACTLTRLTAAPAVTPAGACVWWTLSAAGKVSEVCWSRSSGVPLLLRSGGRTVLSVTKVETLGRFPAAALPEGWQEYDADEDLAPD